MADSIKEARRTFAAALSVAPLGLAAFHRDGFADARAGKIICPFGPGGISDLLSRTMAAELQGSTSRSWQVENVPGAGGAVGAARVARSAPDGLTILKAGTGTFRTLGGRAEKATGFDPLRDLRAVAVVGSMPLVVVGRSDLRVRGMRDYADILRLSGAPMTYATIGVGSTPHVCAALLARHARVEGVHVPYKGSAAVVQAVMSGEVPLAVVDPMLVAPRLASGELLALGLSSASSNAQLPGVVPLIEQGFTGIDVTTWLGFFVPSGTPDSIMEPLAANFRKAIASDTFSRTLRTGFIEGPKRILDDAQRFVEADVRAFQRWMSELGIGTGTD